MYSPRGETQLRPTREEQRAETKRRLLVAAARAFAQHGFEGAAIDQIAEDAGFSRGAFYANFKTKGEVFLLLLRQHLAAELTTLEAGLARIHAVDEIAPMVERRYRNLGKDTDWCLLMTEFQLSAVRGGAHAAESRALFEDYRTRFGELIAALCVRLGVEPSIAPYELAVSQIALAHGLAVQRASNPEISPGLAARALGIFVGGAFASGKSERRKK